MSRTGTRLMLKGLPKGGSLTELAAFLAHSLRNTSPNRFLHRLEQVRQQVSAVALDENPGGWVDFERAARTEWLRLQLVAAGVE